MPASGGPGAPHSGWVSAALGGAAIASVAASVGCFWVGFAQGMSLLVDVGFSSFYLTPDTLNPICLVTLGLSPCLSVAGWGIAIRHARMLRASRAQVSLSAGSTGHTMPHDHASAIFLLLDGRTLAKAGLILWTISLVAGAAWFISNFRIPSV